MKHYLILVLLLFSSVSALSQSKVSGVIKDELGKPVPFANVFFKDSRQGTISDEKGRFYLESNSTYSTLVISFMGYNTEEVELLKRNNYGLEVILKEDLETLSEVVVYSGKTSKKNNPAIDILRKIWENRRRNGVQIFNQYQYKKYEKIEFDFNGLDSSHISGSLFQKAEFIYNQIDTSKVTGKSYLPIFINESVSDVYGDNLLRKKKEILEGNKNSGFENNHIIIDFVRDMYYEYDIYDNYLKLFEKAFTSPLSRTGIDVYNYVLRDSAYIDNKWCYNITYYPRRPNELTFKGDFWVNDTTWAIKDINLHASKNANLNWVRDVYIEQQFDVLNDSIFLITRDYFMSDFSLFKNEKSTGIYTKRTTLYDDYVFDVELDKKFYAEQRVPYEFEIYNRSDEYWEEARMERLSRKEKGIYQMLDTLTAMPQFKKFYRISTSLASGYYLVGNIDFGPIFSVVGFNEAEGTRIRLGGRTYFGQHDPWRLEGFLAYGIKDDRLKYGFSAKWLVDPQSRLILFGGNRRDVEQMGASLTRSDDVLGRNLASSSLISEGRNDRLSRINLTTVGFDFEPWRNFIVRVTGTYRTLKSATDNFSIDYKVFENGIDTGEIKTELKQSEIEFALEYTPGKKTSTFGVERLVTNEGLFPKFYASYGYGMKDVLDSDFEYTKLQILYNQIWNLGGIGNLSTTVEMGKTFGTVPLSLLNPVPGNQTYFSIYNTFTQLDYYEFVSDSYSSLHLQHDFGGRIFSRIPGLRKLDLREIFGFRAVYGTISKNNIRLNASNIPYQAPEDIYWEWSAGLGNIFKVLRIDFNFRGNYRELPDARNFGITAYLGINF